MKGFSPRSTPPGWRLVICAGLRPLGGNGGAIGYRGGIQYWNGGPVRQNIIGFQASPINLSGVCAPPPCTNNGSAFFQVGPGVLKAYADARRPANETFAGGGLADSVTLTVPGAPMGTPGSFNGGIFFNFTENAKQGLGAVELLLQLGAFDSLTGDPVANFVEGGTWGTALPAPNIQTGAIPISYNFR